jgi:hypothetical protein
MNRAEDKFWDWATRSAVRFGGALLAIHAIVTAPIRKKARHG